MLTDWDKGDPIASSKYKEKTFKTVSEILNCTFQSIPAMRFAPSQVKSRFYVKS